MNQVLIKFDSDIQEAIESNGINIEEYIKRELDCTVSHEDLITDENKEKSKDFYLAVNFVAGSAGLYIVSAAISKLVRTLYRKPILVEEIELEPITENGKILKNKNGDVIFKVKKINKLLEPEKLNQNEELSLKIPKTLLKFSSKDQSSK